MTERPSRDLTETREGTIELGETRRGLDSTGLPPPRAVELIGQSADVTPAAGSDGGTVQQASAAPPPADYAD
jgi:hypothetical protein